MKRIIIFMTLSVLLGTMQGATTADMATEVAAQRAIYNDSSKSLTERREACQAVETLLSAHPNQELAKEVVSDLRSIYLKPLAHEDECDDDRNLRMSAIKAVGCILCNNPDAPLAVDVVLQFPIASNCRYAYILSTVIKAMIHILQGNHLPEVAATVFDWLYAQYTEGYLLSDIQKAVIDGVRRDIFIAYPEIFFSHKPLVSIDKLLKATKGEAVYTQIQEMRRSYPRMQLVRVMKKAWEKYAGVPPQSASDLLALRDKYKTGSSPEATADEVARVLTHRKLCRVRGEKWTSAETGEDEVVESFARTVASFL